MYDEIAAATEQICSAFTSAKLPRWLELPDLELYMDQVISLMDRYLGAYPGFDEKGLTAAMVNNYVKQGMMPPPVKKKYTREHLAYLIMICLLKASLPIAAIHRLISDELERSSPEELYDRFCLLFENTVDAVSDSMRQSGSEQVGNTFGHIWFAALRAQAEQALALKLYGAAFSDADAE